MTAFKRKGVPSRETVIKQSRKLGKQAMTKDDAYRVGAKKGGKMNAGLKAYLAKKKKKGKK
jgi:hypothetical protein